MKDERKNVFMEFGDYKKMPKLRFFVTPEIREMIERANTLNKADIPSRAKRRYKIGERSLPLKYLYEDPELFMNIIRKQPKYITHGGVKVILPNEITENIAYLTGFICGDGNLIITKKQDYWVSIHNKEIPLLEKISDMIKNIFDYETFVRNGHDCYFIIIRSMVIHSFFNKIMEIENGRKENIKIPEKIKGNKKLVRSFIAGFFDAEGSVWLKKNNVTCQIAVSQKEKGILEEIKDELIKDDIKMKFYRTSKNHWILYGNKDSLKPFSDKIPFIHPNKKNKLNIALRNQLV